MKTLPKNSIICITAPLLSTVIFTSMNHNTIATRVEHISMATGILAGLSAAGAALAEPTGMDAIGVWLGISDEPLIVRIAPLLGALATVSGTVSGFTYFVAQRKRRQTRNNTEGERAD
jgi:hypothetical protein